MCIMNERSDCNWSTVTGQLLYMWQISKVLIEKIGLNRSQCRSRLQPLLVRNGFLAPCSRPKAV